MSGTIEPILPTNTRTSGTTSASSTSALTSDFETFLKMLTAQAQNQDPLEPIGSSEYAAQLAQFSMVEQQVKTNETLSVLVAKLGQPGFSELAGWVGLEVTAVAPANYQGEPVTISWPRVPDADKAILKIVDSNGATVDRIEFSTTTQSVVWNGQDSSGNAVPFGLYSFAVESYAKDVLVENSLAAVSEKVFEAQVAGGEITLVLSGGQTILPSDVASVRAKS